MYLLIVVLHVIKSMCKQLFLGKKPINTRSTQQQLSMREIEKERRRYTDDRQIGHMYVRYVVNDWYECLRRMTFVFKM